MTYTFKLARRLAILRDLAMLTAFALLVGCAGEPTAPGTGASSASSQQSFRVVPSAVTIETHQPIRFRGDAAVFGDDRPRYRGEAGRHSGDAFPTRLLWESSGGTIDVEGNFIAAEPGTYKVIGKSRGRNKADTSVVVVVPSQPNLVRVTLSPASLSLEAAASHAFTAAGVLSDSSTVAIGVTWAATGGSIDPSGLYTAGATGGSFRVIARNTEGSLADTAVVSVSEPEVAEPPSPAPPPAPALAQVVLKPASFSLVVGSTKQFSAYGRTTDGDSVVVQVAFTATGGRITAGGLYTAGTSTGSYHVIASAEGLADTAAVSLVPPVSGSTALGAPFGPFGAWSGTALKTNTDMFSSNINNVTPSNLLERIEVARRKGIKMMIQMTGGHEPYLTNGVFDMAKWKATMDTWDTPTLRQAVEAAVADGTIIGNSVMDEPHVSGLGDGNTWGPAGTMTKARVDEMCGYVKGMFPTLPVGVVHQHFIFEPTKSYNVCEFIVSQYASRFGSVTAFRDSALAYGRRDGVAIAFSLNILNGGIQAPRDGLWNCPLTTTGGRGTYDPNCRMTAQQVREFGLTLGTAGCALMMWRYDDAFMSRTDNQEAFREVAARMASMPAKSCRA